MLNYLTSFFYSGLLVAGSKYVATWFNPALAPIIAGFPIGILGSFFLNTEQQKKEYYAGFVYSSIILTISVFLIYTISVLFSNISVNIISIIGLILWGLISLLTIYFMVIRKT